MKAKFPEIICWIQLSKRNARYVVGVMLNHFSELQNCPPSPHKCWTIEYDKSDTCVWFHYPSSFLFSVLDISLSSTMNIHWVFIGSNDGNFLFFADACVPYLSLHFLIVPMYSFLLPLGMLCLLMITALFPVPTYVPTVGHAQTSPKNLPSVFPHHLHLHP